LLYNGFKENFRKNEQKMLVILIIFLLFIPKITFPADLSLVKTVGLYSHKSAQKKGHKVKFNQLKQVAAFELKKNADKFAKKLKKEGFEVEVRKGVTKNKKVIYRVLARKIEKLPKSAKSAQKKGHKVKFNQLKQVAAFELKKNADKFAKKLKKEGFEVEVRKGVTKNKKVIYRVLARKIEKLPKSASSHGKVKHDIPEKAFLTEKSSKTKTPSVELSEPLEKPLTQEIPGEARSVATFKIFKNKESADEFVKQLKKEGFDVSMSSSTTKDQKTEYTVFARKSGKLSEEAISSETEPSGEVKKDMISEEPSEENISIASEEPAEEIEEPSSETAIPEEVRQEAPSKETTVEIKEKQVKSENIYIKTEEVSRKDTSTFSEVKQDVSVEKESQVPVPEKTEEISSKEEKPVGTERITADVFGSRRGYVHPVLSVIEYYSDNVFNSNDAKKSDFVTVISPGIWLTVPHINERLLSINSSTVSPGGFSFSRNGQEFFRRYQAYLAYDAEIEQYAKHTSGNTIDHKIEGLFQYNLRGGLSMDLADQYLISHDIWGTGISTELDKFRSNLFNVIFAYDVSDKLKLRADYSNFFVHYDASRNNFRDRDDNAISGYIFYRFKPKTSVFVEYQFIDIKYNEGILFDSQEHHYFGGLQWDITAKSKGSIKAGYGIKDFSRSTLESSKDFILEAQIDHKFTPKTSLVLKASRKTNETNISTTDFTLSNSVEAKYIQRLTGKITGEVDLSYTNDNYKGDVTFGGETKEIKDNYFTGAFALQYKFREWLEMNIGYIHNMRDSNFSEFDYSSNIVFIRFTGSL
jgi:biotin operon repressor